MEEPIYYINGKFVSKSQALISVTDLGLLRGYGVFDFLVTYNQIPFLLKEHLIRLIKSSEEIGIKLPWSNKYLNELILKLIKKNSRIGELQIRIVVTGGVSLDNLTPTGRPTLAVLVDKRVKLPKTLYTNGASIITVQNGRSILHAKTLNYIKGISAHNLAVKKGAIEAVYVNGKTNEIYEGVTSNIFIVKNNVVITPKDGILNGITRDVVIKICKKDFQLKEKKITTSKLYKADEVFITATNKEVIPIVKVDGKRVGNGNVGEITKLLMDKYLKLTTS